MSVISDLEEATHTAGMVGHPYDAGIGQEMLNHPGVFTMPQNTRMRRPSSHGYAYVYSRKLTAAMIALLVGKICALSFCVKCLKSSTLDRRPHGSVGRANASDNNAILCIKYKEKISMKRAE